MEKPNTPGTCLQIIAGIALILLLFVGYISVIGIALFILVSFMSVAWQFGIDMSQVVRP
jgi:predicted RND superfamily exporter protein